MCATGNRGSPLRVAGEAGLGLGGALSRLLGAGQEINCEEEIGNIEREATLLHLAYAQLLMASNSIKAKSIIFMCEMVLYYIMVPD